MSSIPSIPSQSLPEPPTSQKSAPELAQAFAQEIETCMRLLQAPSDLHLLAHHLNRLDALSKEAQHA